MTDNKTKLPIELTMKQFDMRQINAFAEFCAMVQVEVVIGVRDDGIVVINTVCNHDVCKDNLIKCWNKWLNPDKRDSFKIFYAIVKRAGMLDTIYIPN